MDGTRKTTRRPGEASPRTARAVPAAGPSPPRRASHPPRARATIAPNVEHGKKRFFRSLSHQRKSATTFAVQAVLREQRRGPSARGGKRRSTRRERPRIAPAPRPARRRPAGIANSLRDERFDCAHHAPSIDLSHSHRFDVVWWQRSRRVMRAVERVVVGASLRSGRRRRLGVARRNSRSFPTAWTAVSAARRSPPRCSRNTAWTARSLRSSSVAQGAKNLFFLLDVWREVAPTRRMRGLVVAGSGPLQVPLERYAASFA